MIVERLKDEEFEVLTKIDDGFRPDPASSIVIVARENGAIVGRMMLLSLVHLEGTWIDPTHRCGRILVKMMKEMEKQAYEAGVRTMFAYSGSADVSDYLGRLGYKQSPLTIFEKELIPCH